MNYAHIYQSPEILDAFTGYWKPLWKIPSTDRLIPLFVIPTIFMPYRVHSLNRYIVVGCLAKMWITYKAPLYCSSSLHFTLSFRNGESPNYFTDTLNKFYLTFIIRTKT